MSHLILCLAGSSRRGTHNVKVGDFRRGRGGHGHCSGDVRYGCSRSVRVLGSIFRGFDDVTWSDRFVSISVESRRGHPFPSSPPSESGVRSASAVVPAHLRSLRGPTSGSLLLLFSLEKPCLDNGCDAKELQFRRFGEKEEGQEYRLRWCRYRYRKLIDLIVGRCVPRSVGFDG